jgi:tetratricopeptide (TPR) repeat protein
MKVADLSYDGGRFKAAETDYTRALEIYENVLGKTHPAIGFTASKLARTYMALEKFSQADECYQKALFVTSEALGKDHPAVVIVLEEYLNLLYLTQNDDAAQKLEAGMKVPAAADS